MKATIAKLAHRGSKSFKDLVMITIIISVLLMLAIVFEVSEDVLDWFLKFEKHYNSFEFHEIFGLFIILIVATGFFALRRWRELVGEIGERKRLAAELLVEKEQMTITLNSIGDGVIATDIAGRIIMLNPVAESLTGWNQADAINRQIEEVFRIINEYTREPVDNPIAKVLLSGRIVGLANHTILISRNGNEISIADSAAPIIDEVGKTHGVIMVFRDVSNKRLQEKELQESEEKFRELFNNANDAIFLTELMPNGNSGKFIEVNELACKYLGYSKGELLGLSTNEIEEHKINSKKHLDWVKKGHITYEAHHISKTGQRIPVEVNSHIFSFKGQKLVLSIARDITERIRSDEQLRFLGMHDAFTKLYNRAYFEEEMLHLDHEEHAPQGIIMCDIDGLKLVNDTMGHDVGDALLMSAVTAIKSAFDKEAIVARVGGDEFAMLLPNTSRVKLEAACHAIRQAVDFYNLDHQELPLSISIGFAVRGKNLLSMSDVFKDADNNMYREKLYRSQSARSAIVQTLMQALEARDFITEGHAESLQYLVSKIAQTIGLAESNRTDLRLLAQFHDIGKVGIPDRILFKPGPLNPDDTNEMRRHAEIGHRIALSAPDLVPIASWILKHHEWWNGAGYPLGLFREEIPLECRILAIVDAYDAMTRNRPYRNALKHSAAIAELIRCAGTQFDPELVVEFVKVIQQEEGENLAL